MKIKMMEEEIIVKTININEHHRRRLQHLLLLHQFLSHLNRKYKFIYIVHPLKNGHRMDGQIGLDNLFFGYNKKVRYKTTYVHNTINVLLLFIHHFFYIIITYIMLEVYYLATRRYVTVQVHALSNSFIISTVFHLVVGGRLPAGPL